MTAPPTTDLAVWLLARLDEDEAAARAATTGEWRHNPSKEWHTDEQMLARARRGQPTIGGEEFVGALSTTGAMLCVAATGPADQPEAMADAAHIARQDPARVLATVAAMRRIVEEHAEVREPWDQRGECAACGTGSYGCGPAGDPGHYEGIDYPCPTLRALASIYADADGFDPRWAE